MIEFIALCAVIYGGIAFSQYVVLENAIEAEKQEKEFQAWRLEFWTTMAQATSRQAREIGQLVDRCGKM